MDSLKVSHKTQDKTQKEYVSPLKKKDVILIPYNKVKLPNYWNHIGNEQGKNLTRQPH